MVARLKLKGTDGRAPPILSYPFDASNMRFNQDMINVSYPVSLS